MKNTQNLNKREWLLLSAYLDGQLSQREEHQVEDLLQTNPASQSALEGLRRTRQVLKHTSVRKVPRNFTLSAEMVRRPFLPSFSRVLSYSSALAGILMVAVIALDIFSGVSSPLAVGQAADAPASLLAAESEKAVIEETPQLFYWGYSPTGGEGLGSGKGSSDPAYGTGGGGGEGANVEPGPAVEELVPKSLQEQEQTEESGQAVPEEMQEESLQESAEPDDRDEAPTRESSSPILGIRPTEERGSVLSDQIFVEESEFPDAEIPWRLIEIIFGATAVLTGLTAFLLGKRK